MPAKVKSISLEDTTRERYLNYALSVITSRALPDIRDGLKPVQRRILYAMFNSLRLYPEGRHRKSATVVGDVMGKYHPHGDSAIYDAMVRMAQNFSLRDTLVDGQGNFGSLDGDSAAAMRYTEAKLTPLAMTLLIELKKQTVDFRPNFDGTLSEPVVLPAQFPNLLVNGATGIAVGMATNIPPHNLGEVISALIYLIDSPNARLSTILSKFIQGPDFPTGGRILNTEEELREIYDKGEGPIELRGEFRMEGAKQIVVTSIPYGVSKSGLIESIAQHIIAGKVPQLVDIRDESTDEVRIVLETRRGADPDAAMAYLFKHTSLQTRFHVNLTCLMPTEGTDVCTPAKVDLLTILDEFLDFRMDVLVRRVRFELDQIQKRIHILKGFAIIFDALDEAIKIIRSSKNKGDSAQCLKHRFKLDDVQTDAILETKLYKLSRMEIDAIMEELAAKKTIARKLRALLKDENERWTVIRDELIELQEQFETPRLTAIEGPDEQREYSAEDYIIAEDVFAVVTRDGWIKRQKSYTDPESIRVRDGDSVGWIWFGSTRSVIVFLTNFGKAYSIRKEALPSTTGHGIPIQKLFDFKDKERVVGVISMDERSLPVAMVDDEDQQDLFGDLDDEEVGPYVFAMSSAGQALRIPAGLFSEVSTKAGRRFMRVTKEQTVVNAVICQGDEHVCVASKQGNALIFPASQVPVMKNAAKGVRGMKVAAGDYILGFVLSTTARIGLEVVTSRGRTEIIRTTKMDVGNRGNKGRQIIKRGIIREVVLPIVAPENS